MADPFTTIPDPDKCPKICTEIGAFKKVNKTDGKSLEEVKTVEEARANPTRSTPDARPVPVEEREKLRPRPSGEEYLPNLKPGPDGKVDWTPLGNMTGTRPPVNKYSASRYSLGEWRNHNAHVLDPKSITDSNIVEYNAQTAIMQAFGGIDKTQAENKSRLKRKAKDLFRWKAEIERACKGITEEVELLEMDRQRMKHAFRTLMLPEAISRECLELRSYRAEPDLVVDLAEQELVNENKLLAEVRATYKNALGKIEEQMKINKAVKHRIEYDWCDKIQAYNNESLNIGLNTKSPNILFKPGATRYGEYSAPLKYWEFFTRESVQNCEAARQKSMDLRNSINGILVNGGRKLRLQADKTDRAFAEIVTITQELCTTLEETLKNTIQRILDMEKLIADLRSTVQKMDAAMKLAQTRLDNRNSGRPHGESVRDQPHLGLLDEVKKIHGTVMALLSQIKNAEKVRSELCDKRLLLEKDIAAKRKSLNIDRDRCGMVRSHYPSAVELSRF